MTRPVFSLPAAGLLSFILASILAPAVGFGESRFSDLIREDWEHQEQRLGRDCSKEAAVQELYERGRKLIERIGVLPGAPDLSAESAVLDRIADELPGLKNLAGVERRAIYFELRAAVRSAALKNPLFAGRKLLFMQRNRFVCQMLHEYLGYYYDYGDVEGGGVYVLEQPGYSREKTDLVNGRMPRGNYTTLALAYDAGLIYFAFAPRTDGPAPDFYSKDRKCFDIYAMRADGQELRRLTQGTNDYFDPCPLPDGGIAFMSSRRGGFTRCNNPWEPLPAHTLHRMDADGSNIRILSVHETSEWHPNVLHDGRIIYTRWDYVDRSAAHFHGLWITNPDGTGTRALFGNYTQRINAMYQAHPVPGSNKIAFLAGAHHANVGGSLVLLDPDRARIDPESGEDVIEEVEVLTPEVCFPEAPDWPDSYFHSPWPLSEDFFLVSFSFDPLPGMGSGVYADTHTGLYLFDRFGNLELLYRDAGISSMYPIPFEARACPPVIPSNLDPRLGDEGEFIISNLGRSHFAMPEGREIRELRIYQILPKSETHVANRPRIGNANAESARMLLGTVPVEQDGSAYFRAPAHKPLAFQAVDAAGRAVQGMRSAVYLQPGERRSCVGCHESVGDVDAGTTPFAMHRGPSAITPGPDGTQPWSYARLVQPVLDRRCVSCHGKDGDAPCLEDGPDEQFTASFRALSAFARWYEWGDKSISQIVTRPGEMPADVSPLTAVLEDADHQGKTGLTDEELRSLYLWLDGNSAFYGAYSIPEQIAQRRGEAIPPPALQ